jgi:hypothetical protein
MIYLLFLLQIKHFLVDFLLQTKYQYLNKGKFLHFGGILHALIHGFFTSCICLFNAVWQIAILLGILDFILHYFIDYFKVNITKKYQWSTNKDNTLVITSNKYFVAFGFDQLLHQLTYILIFYITIWS